MNIVTIFEFFDLVKEKVTGFQGVVMGVTKYSTECTHYGLLSPKLSKEGKVKDWQWFDESRLVQVKKAIGVKPTNKTSGPDMNPRQY